MMRRVVVTGLGTISPLGVGTRASWTRLVKGDCGVSAYRDIDELKGNPCRVAAYVPIGSRVDSKWDAREWITGPEERRMGKFAQFAVAAAEEALLDSGWQPKTEEDFETTGVCVGSGIGNLDEAYQTSVAFEKEGYRHVSPLFVPRLLINLAAGHISMKYGLRGPNQAVTTACTTGLHAIGDAARTISFSPDCNVMLAGGAESCIHPVAMAGFARARSLTTISNDDPLRSSRPFDINRSGFVMGEGAGIVLLEELEHARNRGAKIYAEIKGYGLSSDAHHITAPRADGHGPYMAMHRALRMGKLNPGQVDYVNAHATSTILGDTAENSAIRRLLLDASSDQHWSNPERINVSSSKGAIGHLLGASGAVEMIFTTLAVHTGILPPTINLSQPGHPPASAIVAPHETDEPDLTVQTEAASCFDLNYVPNEAQDVGRSNCRVALTNSFGFGGTNASLCLAQIDG